MAHETLKNLITNNIKTNGHNAITAQILQDVLIAMVDEYPDISGYATRTWVQQQDYAPKEWVENKHYATQDWANQKFENYLPLAGGTMAGTIVCGELASGYYMLNNEELAFSIGIAANYRMFVKIGFEDNEPIIRFAARNGQLIGTEIKQTNVTSDAFIKREGTAAQFLKADGSVDGNAYLPLTGGTIRENLHIGNRLSISAEGGSPEDPESYDFYLENGVIVIDYTVIDRDSVRADSIIKNGGTSDEVLCADGSTKTLSELKAALNAL